MRYDQRSRGGTEVARDAARCLGACIVTADIRTAGIRDERVSDRLVLLFRYVQWQQRRIRIGIMPLSGLASDAQGRAGLQLSHLGKVGPVTASVGTETASAEFKQTVHRKQ